jgi:hypothetical protein
VGHWLRGNALGSLALFVALSGTSYAVVNAATKKGTLKACASHNGTLQLATAKGHCGGGEKKVQINQQGPQGPPGNPGAPGGQGAPGSTGPSDAYTASTPGGPITLPAGAYEVFGRAQIHDVTDKQIVCAIRDASANVFDSTRQDITPGGLRYSISLVAPVQLASADQLSLACDPSIETSELTAIKVGTLHSQ